MIHDPYIVAAVIAVALGLQVGVVAFFMGANNLRDEWRDYCAEPEPRFQQFDIEPRYTDAEFARIAAELEIPYDWKQQGS